MYDVPDGDPEKFCDEENLVVNSLQSIIDALKHHISCDAETISLLKAELAQAHETIYHLRAEHSQGDTVAFPETNEINPITSIENISSCDNIARNSSPEQNHVPHQIEHSTYPAIQTMYPRTNLETFQADSFQSSDKKSSQQKFHLDFECGLAQSNNNFEPAVCNQQTQTDRQLTEVILHDVGIQNNATEDIFKKDFVQSQIEIDNTDSSSHVISTGSQELSPPNNREIRLMTIETSENRVNIPNSEPTTSCNMNIKDVNRIAKQLKRGYKLKHEMKILSERLREEIRSIKNQTDVIRSKTYISQRNDYIVNDAKKHQHERGKVTERSNNDDVPRLQKSFLMVKENVGSGELWCINDMAIHPRFFLTSFSTAVLLKDNDFGIASLHQILQSCFNLNYWFAEAEIGSIRSSSSRF